jgi:hypothetical protein
MTHLPLAKQLSLHVPLFQELQFPFYIHTACISCQFPICPKDPVAGDQDGECAMTAEEP